VTTLPTFWGKRQHCLTQSKCCIKLAKHIASEKERKSNKSWGWKTYGM